MSGRRSVFGEEHGGSRWRGRNTHVGHRAGAHERDLCRHRRTYPHAADRSGTAEIVESGHERGPTVTTMRICRAMVCLAGAAAIPLGAAEVMPLKPVSAFAKITDEP